jgi:hypothetical protein
MNGRVPVWVNGVCYDGVWAAAEEVSRCSGGKVSAIRLGRLLRRRSGTAVINGISISTSEPKPERAEGVIQEPPPVRKVSLLTYSRGDTPIDRGVCRAGP